MKAVAIFELDKLDDRAPAHALVADVDLVVTRYDDAVSVLYGCLLYTSDAADDN